MHTTSDQKTSHNHKTPGSIGRQICILQALYKIFSFPSSPNEEAVNPYRAPLASTRQASPSEPTNPAKPLMLLIGGLYAVVSPMAFLVGFQTGLRELAGSALIFILACGTIFLALQKFTPSCRTATIVWGFCLIACFAFAALFEYSFGLMLLIVIPIPILALRQNPCREALTHRDTGAANQSDSRESPR
jgi:hypothetical protein